MRRFANWTNLSETTFLLAPSDERADYRVRIFTPERELPFAGHPTLGSAHAWLEAGGPPARQDVVVQECGVGLVPVRRSPHGQLAFKAPPLIRSGPVDEPLLDEVAASLGIKREDIVDAQWADNGPGWVAVELASADAVLALAPGVTSRDIGVFGPYPSGSPVAFEVRAFTPLINGTGEDPVTGSLNASLAMWLLSAGKADRALHGQPGHRARPSGPRPRDRRRRRLGLGGRPDAHADLRQRPSLGRARLPSVGVAADQAVLAAGRVGEHGPVLLGRGHPRAERDMQAKRPRVGAAEVHVAAHRVARCRLFPPL